MISVKTDIKGITKKLNVIQKKQIPFATAKALTATAFNARKAVQKQMPAELDRPTPFTIRGVRVEKATKRSLRSAVFITPEVYDYLKWQITGGTKHGNSAVPTGAKKLNKYGNIPGKRKGLIKSKAQRFGKLRDTTAVWETKGGKRNRQTRLLIVIEKKVTYKKRFKFREGVFKVVNKDFAGLFDKAMRDALRTAR